MTPRPGNAGVASAASGRFKGEDAPWAQRRSTGRPGRRCAYLPGYAEKRARDMMPGIAKADAIDAEVIARTAMGMPRALGQIAAEDAAARSLMAPSSQREHAVASGTGAKNRFRAVPLEADP